MSKKNVTLTGKQWNNVVESALQLADMADSAHDLSHVESLLTHLSADGVMDADAGSPAPHRHYPHEASGPAETVAEVIKQRTFMMRMAASAFAEFVVAVDETTHGGNAA